MCALAVACGPSMQWYHSSRYAQADTQWERDPYRCELDAAQRSASMGRSDILSAAYADAVAESTWEAVPAAEGLGQVLDSAFADSK